MEIVIQEHNKNQLFFNKKNMVLYQSKLHKRKDMENGV